MAKAECLRHGLDLVSLPQQVAGSDDPDLPQPALAGDAQALFHHAGEGAFSKAEALAQPSDIPAALGDLRIEPDVPVLVRIKQPPVAMGKVDPLALPR